MENNAIVNSWLEAFGSNIGINLNLNQQGAALFNYDNKVSIGIETVDSSNWASFYSPVYDVSSLSTYRQHFLMIYILGKNLPEGGLKGASFAFDNDSNSVMLCYNFSSKNTTSQLFDSSLMHFINLAVSQSDSIEKHIATIPEYSPKYSSDKKHVTTRLDSSSMPTLLDFV